MNKEFWEICSYLPERIVNIFLAMDNKIIDSVQEIRLNSDAPLKLKNFGKSLYINSKGVPVTYDKGIGVFQNEMETIFMNICNSSVYAHENSLKQGFVTLKGGHRVGIAATAVTKNGDVVSLRNVSSLNFRIARDYKNCSSELMEYIVTDEGVLNTFIFSPPAGGKTTMLRDIARNLSIMGKTVCVIDERSEISGNFGGVSRYDLCGCDILNGYPKQAGIIQALRTMSPDVIICDEIGTSDESDEILKGMNSGVSFILTAHASSIGDAEKRQAVNILLGEFDNAVILKGGDSPGKVDSVIQLC